MPTWYIGGFRIVEHLTDHPPRHVHVYKDNAYIGKYAVNGYYWIEGPYHARAQAESAIRKWLEEQEA